MLMTKLTSIVAEFKDNGSQRRISVELHVPVERQCPTAHTVQQDVGRRFWWFDDGQLDVRRVASVSVLRCTDVQSAVFAPRSVDRQPRPHHLRQRPCCRRACRRLEVKSLQPVYTSSYASHVICLYLTQRTDIKCIL